MHPVYQEQAIPVHWQHFADEPVLAGIPGKGSDQVYAVCPHSDNAGRNKHGLRAPA